MKRALATIAGAATLALGLIAGPAAAQPDASPGVPPWGSWAGPGVVQTGAAGSAGPFWGTLLGHGPVGCYFTRVRADNRWLRAEVCDWNPGFGAP